MFQNGILALVLVSGAVILISRGETGVAINLYALGVFCAFTLSQAGMVVRWWRQRGTGWPGRLLMNALGAVTTGLVLVVIVISKFGEGAWAVTIAIPVLVLALARIRRRYRRVQAALRLQPGDDLTIHLPPRSQTLGNQSIVWLPAWGRPALEALRYACTISDRVVAVWVCGEGDDRELIQRQWQQSVIAGEGSSCSCSTARSPP